MLPTKSFLPGFLFSWTTSLEFYCLPYIQIEYPSENYQHVADVGGGLEIYRSRLSVGIKRGNLDGGVVGIVCVWLLNSGHDAQGLQGVVDTQCAVRVQVAARHEAGQYRVIGGAGVEDFVDARCGARRRGQYC